MFAFNAKCNKNELRSLVSVVLLLALLTPTLSTSVNASPTYTEVGGPIISNTTWTLANSPYIATSNVQVMTGVTLTIEAGVVVKFNSAKLLQVDGTLIARGTANSPIIFTYNDASPAYWGQISFSNSSIDATFDGAGNYTGGSILQYCTVQYAGSGTMINGAIETKSQASPFIDHCTVRYNMITGIYYVGTTQASSKISNNTVAYNSTSAGNCGGISASNSTVSNNSVIGNSAYYYYGGIYASTSTVSNNSVIGNSARLDGGGIFVHESTVSNNSVIGNQAQNGGGIYSEGGGSSDHGSIIVTNTVQNNQATGFFLSSGGGIYVRGIGTVSGNITSANFALYEGGGILANGNGNAKPTITDNTIVGNQVPATGQGSGLWTSDANIFRNTIIGNYTTSPQAIVGGLAIGSGGPQIHYNNLYGNSNYDVVITYGGDYSGTNNYWGTTAYVDINRQIYDWYDDTSRGRFLYIPYLQDPDPNAPVPPPRNLRGDFTSNSATFSWDPIPSTTTGYGYKVYYGVTYGPPYTGTGAAQGDSPIDVGNATSYSLTGLGSGIYYGVVTAYDTHGHESWYSNQINRLQANFTAWPTEGVKPLTVVFTDTSSAGYTQRLWNFGDAVTSTLYRPTHIYTTAGVYTVSLTISGPGDIDTLTRTNFITVTGAPPPSASVVKSVTPQGAVWYGDALTYTLVISATPGTRVGLYDPLDGTTFTRFVAQPAGITHVNGVITGTLTVTPTQYAIVTFVARVGVPGTVGFTTDVINQACVYISPGTLSQCKWSNSVTNSAFRPYSIFLPVVLKNQ